MKTSRTVTFFAIPAGSKPEVQIIGSACPAVLDHESTNE
jgi:hypothetical protein